MIENIELKSEPSLEQILADYCENVGTVPTEQGKAFFREWNGKVPGELIRQCIFAGIYYAVAHPDDLRVRNGEE